MVFEQRFRYFPATCAAVITLFLSSSVYAQKSLSELEQELLFDGVSEASDSQPSNTKEASDLLQEFADESSKKDFEFEKEDRQQVEKAALEKVDEASKGPEQIPFEHILVVKHQYINKKGRHEISPLTLSYQPADSFRQQVSFGFSWAYHFSESWAVEVLHAGFTTNYRSSLEEDINSGVKSVPTDPGLALERVEPVLSLGASLWWTPFKGKSATRDSIYHFEGYFLAGGGLTVLETVNSGMFMGGGGVRLFLNKRAILKIEVRDYIDFASGAGQRVNFLVGASVLLGGDSK